MVAKETLLWCATLLVMLASICALGFGLAVLPKWFVEYGALGLGSAMLISSIGIAGVMEVTRIAQKWFKENPT